ncbi:MAG: hypothetical protein V1690_03785 [Candidatus Moraniibacteriota bacterium]
MENLSLVFKKNRLAMGATKMTNAIMLLIGLLVFVTLVFCGVVVVWYAMRRNEYPEIEEE